MQSASRFGAARVAAVLLVASLAGAIASADAAAPGVAVGGAVSAPTSYTLAQLAAMPQTTFGVPARAGAAAHTDQGVALESLVNGAAPSYPYSVPCAPPLVNCAKNPLLRVLVTVSGLSGSAFTLALPGLSSSTVGLYPGLPMTFALGELDPNFGNHPAYLALTQDGAALPWAELVVPGDTNATRTRYAVGKIAVAVTNPPVTTPAGQGDLTIEAGPLTSVLTGRQLESLPAQTLSVSYLGPHGASPHTETGPTLDEVLLAAHIPPAIVSSVAAVGSDDYVATVTPAEAHVGGRPLLISTAEDGVPLTQPRLVTDGDAKGGRYVSGVVDLAVGFRFGLFQ